MKRILFTLMLSMLFAGVYAQEFQVPKDYKLDKAEEYAPYEKDIIKCVDWLINKPVNEEVDKRKQANAFLLKWLIGSPTVHIGLKQEIVTFIKGEPDLLMIFMGGWARQSLLSKDYNNKVEGNLAGIEAVIEFYSKNKQFLKKDKEVEKYIKLKAKGTLKDYITKNA